MFENLLQDSWSRIPNLESLTDQISAGIGELEALYLGAGSDGVPIFAFSRSSGDDPAALVIGGGSGDSVVCLAAAASLLAEDEPLPGFSTWVIVGLDAPRLRHNDGQLGALRPDIESHSSARRSAWGPGEDPETGLPVSFAQLWQPEGSIDPLSCSPESLALARALKRLEPRLVLSLREVPAGGACVASSQELSDQDWDRLVAPLEEIGLHYGPRPMPGHSLPAHPGCLVLHSLFEEARRYKDPDKLAIGPVPTWQFMQSVQPDSLYLSLHLPRFYNEAFSSPAPTTEHRGVEVSHEVRLVRGKEQNTRVAKLLRPGNPADLSEVRVEKVKDPNEPLGIITEQPASCASLAIEAILGRQDVIRRALESWQNTLGHLEGQESERGMQILVAAGDLGAQVRALQTNRRFGEPATEADAAYWSSAYRLETALLLRESLACLRGESDADPKIVALKQELERLSAEQLEGTAGLAPVDAQLLARVAREWVGSAAAMAQDGGPALLRANDQVELCRKRVAEARRSSRAARHLRLPPAERKQADRELREAEDDLKQAEQSLAFCQIESAVASPLVQGEEYSPIPEKSPDEIPAPDSTASAPSSEEEGGSPENEISSEQEPELPSPPADLSVVDESGKEPSSVAHIETDTPEEQPSLDKPEESASMSLLDKMLKNAVKRTGEGGGDLASDQPGDTPVRIASPAADRVDTSDPVSWLSGDDRGRVELDAGLDIEPMLPQKLDIPPEWGRGRLRWKDQIPARNQQPMLRRLARHLLGHDPVEARGVEAEVETPGEEVSIMESRPLAVQEATATGWLKRRAETPDRYNSPPPVLPTVPSGAGGRWDDFVRRPVN